MVDIYLSQAQIRQQKEWDLKALELQDSYETWKAKINSVYERGSKAWALAKNRYLQQQRIWEKEFEEQSQEKREAWDEKIKTFLEEKKEWQESALTSAFNAVTKGTIEEETAELNRKIALSSDANNVDSDVEINTQELVNKAREEFESSIPDTASYMQSLDKGIRDFNIALNAGTIKTFQSFASFLPSEDEDGRENFNGLMSEFSKNIQVLNGVQMLTAMQDMMVSFRNSMHKYNDETYEDFVNEMELNDFSRSGRWFKRKVSTGKKIKHKNKVFYVRDYDKADVDSMITEAHKLYFNEEALDFSSGVPMDGYLNKVENLGTESGMDAFQLEIFFDTEMSKFQSVMKKVSGKRESNKPSEDIEEIGTLYAYIGAAPGIKSDGRPTRNEVGKGFGELGGKDNQAYYGLYNDLVRIGEVEAEREAREDMGRSLAIIAAAVVATVATAGAAAPSMSAAVSATLTATSVSSLAAGTYNSAMNTNYSVGMGDLSSKDAWGKFALDFGVNAVAALATAGAGSAYLGGSKTLWSVGSVVGKAAYSGVQVGEDGWSYQLDGASASSQLASGIIDVALGDSGNLYSGDTKALIKFGSNTVLGGVNSENGWDYRGAVASGVSSLVTEGIHAARGSSSALYGNDGAKKQTDAGKYWTDKGISEIGSLASLGAQLSMRSSSAERTSYMNNYANRNVAAELGDFLGSQMSLNLTYSPLSQGAAAANAGGALGAMMAWGAGVFRREEEEEGEKRILAPPVEGNSEKLSFIAPSDIDGSQEIYADFLAKAKKVGIEEALKLIEEERGKISSTIAANMAFDILDANRENKLDGDLSIFNSPEIIKDLVVLNKITGHNSEENSVTVNGVTLEFSNNKTNKASALENTDVNLFYTLLNAANRSNVDKIHVNYTYWNSATHGNGKSIDIGWIQGVDSNEIHNYRKANDGNSFLTNEEAPESDLMKRFRQEFLNENNGSGYRVWTPHKMVSNGNTDKNGNTVGSYDYDNVIGGLSGLVSALKGKKSGSIEKWYQISDPSIFSDDRIEFKNNSEGHYVPYVVRSQTVKQAYNSWFRSLERNSSGNNNINSDTLWNNYLHYDHGHFEVY